MIVVTTNDLPGHRITHSLGMVRGITVRSRNALADVLGSVQSVFGGRVEAYVKLAEAARAEAYEHLIEQARIAGANAVVAMRYDANEIMDGVTEVLAYGTAVVVEPE
ncbi:MAG TPA: YbjQ family protein [Caulobacteraceae bacterium]